MSKVSRRDFLRTVGATAALGAANTRSRMRLPRSTTALRAVAFDGFAIFDATAVIATVEAVVPGRARELVTAWRGRLFEYQWMRTLGGTYEDFQRTANDALTFAAKSLGIALGASDRQRLVDAQASLQPWPDAAAAIHELRTAGLQLALLSNMTERMLTDGVNRAGLANDFDFILSTDRVRAAKPARQAYAMGPAAIGVPREHIAFVAFAGWDAAGATWFGYPTAWLNRSNAPPEELAATPTLTTTRLDAVVRWVTSNT